MTDVEHSAEDTTDSILPMMHLAPDDPAWQRHARRLVDLMETLWTGRNERGCLQFKSTYFTVDTVDPSPQRACDTPYHTRALLPAMLLWQRTGNERVGKPLCRWLDTWVDAAARSECGKPAGVLPAAIHWPDGRPAGLGEPWWDPRNHGEPTLYQWPSSQASLSDALLLAWHMTGKERYLAPLRSMAEIRRKFLAGRTDGAGEPGTEAYCGRRLAFLAPTLAKYRALSGSDEFDDLLARDYAALVSTGGGDRRAMERSLERSAQALRVNWPGYTSEVRWTDRVLRFPVLFEPDYLFEEGVPGFEKPRPELLYSLATGDPGCLGTFPLNAVRWLTPPRDVAALVTATGPDRFSAELYHFGGEPRPMEAELYLLAPGRYTFEVSADGGAGASGKAFRVTGPPTRIAFDLPPQRLTVLRICRSE